MTDDVPGFLDDLVAEEPEVLVASDAASAVLVNDLKAARVLRERKEALEGEIKEINKILSDPQDGLYPRILRQFDALGITNMKVDGVGTVYTFEMAVPKVLDDEQFIAWLDARGDGGIAKRSIHHQTLRAWYKDKLESGNDVPPRTMVDVYNVREVRFRKS